MQLHEHQRRGLAETADKNRVAIAGYEGLYSVDKNGNIYSEQTTTSRRKGVLKPEIKNGYLSVNRKAMYYFGNSMRTNLERG